MAEFQRTMREDLRKAVGFDAYYEAHINSWDALAGVALVREAGGWTNDFLAANGLHEGSEVLASAPGVTASLRTVCGL